MSSHMECGLWDIFSSHMESLRNVDEFPRGMSQELDEFPHGVWAMGHFQFPHGVDRELGRVPT